MNVIHRFTIQSLRKNRKWTVITIIGLIISTAMLTAVSTFTVSIMSLLKEETIDDTGNWHASITGVSLQQAESVEKSNLVDEVTLRRDVGYAVLQNSKNSGKPYLFIRQLNQTGMKNFRLVLTSGRLPENENELVLPEHLEANGGISYAVGDTLTLAVGNRFSPDGEKLWQSSAFYAPDDSETGEEGEEFVPEFTKAYTVVGIVARPGFENSWAPGYTAISYIDTSTLTDTETADALFLMRHLNKGIYQNVVGLAESIGKSAEDVAYNSELLRYNMIVEDDNMQYVIYGFVGVIMLIIIIASISLIYNAFAISVSERTRQLGILASVGATRRQKKSNVYFEGLIIGLIGIPLGILAGVAGIGITLQAIQPLIGSFTNLSTGGLKLVVSPMALIISVVLAGVTVFISALVPAVRASKIMPIDAIRQSQEIKLNSKKVRTSKLTRKLFGFEAEIALKNLKRSRKKYRITVLSLVISLVLFLTVSYYAELSQSATVLMTDGYNFDIGVSYSEADANETDVVNEKITALKGVTKLTSIQEIVGNVTLDTGDVSPQTATMLSAEGETVSIGTQLLCLDKTAFDNYLSELGLNPAEYKNPDKPKVIAINVAKGIVDSKYASGSIMTAGSAGVKLSYPAESEGADSVSIDLTLGLLTDQRPMGVLIQPFSNLVLLTGEEVFSAVTSKLPDSEWSKNQYTYINCEDAEKIEGEIRTITESLSKGSANLYNIVSETKSEQDMMLFVGVFIYGFIILISLICIANIANTTSTNMSLRRKEFAMLRSVGMTPKSFNRMIRFESIFYGLKSLGYGLPISAGIGFSLYMMQRDVFDFGFIIPWKSYLSAVVLIFLIVAITMFYAIGKIKKENIIDALKMENF